MVTTNVPTRGVDRTQPLTPLSLDPRTAGLSPTIGSDRYARQTIFPPIGDEGQRRIGQTRVLIVGCGALGSAVAKALEMEAAGLDGEERELEMARRFVRIAGTAAQQAGMAGQGMDPQRAARDAVDAALRCHLPRMRQPGLASGAGGADSGTWRRQGRGRIVLDL